MKLVIIIPAYNEESTIRAVLDKIPRTLSGIDRIISLVVDDGSSDNTYEIASKRTAYVARHVINLGVGAALTTGFAAARKLKADIVVMLDADGQHDPDDIKKLIKPILDKRAEIVIGTRMRNTKGMPRIKIIGNFLMNIMTWIFFQEWSSDTQSGMRALSKIALNNVDLQSLGYEICSEMIGEARRAHLKLLEVEITTIYTKYSKTKGQSMINAVNIFTRLISIKMMRKK